VNSEEKLIVFASRSVPMPPKVEEGPAGDDDGLPNERY
jgi:hypothetical protein